MKYKTIYIGLIIFITSCTSWKKELKQHGNENDARMNIMMDFYYKNSKGNSVYLIDNDFDKKKGLYIFNIDENDVPTPIKTDTIGGYTHFFPTQYLEKNKRLFYWQDKHKVLTKKIIDKLTQYTKIDSSWFKKPYDEGPTVNNGPKPKSTYYFVCKNNISKYKKKKAVWIKKENYPKMKCYK